MPQGYFPVLLITFRSFLVLRGGTHSILPKRRNPEYSEFWRFFLSLGVGLGPEFTCWNMGAFLRYGNFALTLPFLPVQFCRVLAKGRHWRILFGLNLAFHGDPWRTSLFSRRKKILQHKCSFIYSLLWYDETLSLCHRTPSVWGCTQLSPLHVALAVRPCPGCTSPHYDCLRAPIRGVR